MFYNRNSAPSCHSYEQATQLLERFSHTPTGRARTPSYLGFRMDSKVMHIRRTDDGDIIMRLHSTDCVTWHPDNSFSVKAWESMSTAGFISSLTPLSVGAKMLATYFKLPAPANGEWSSWRERWASSRVCYAEGTYHPDSDGGHAPDEDTLRVFRYPVVDRKLTREVSKAHHFVDFATWLAVAPYHLDLEHKGEDMQAVSDALRARDFRTAAVHLPPIETPRGFGVADRIKPIPMRGLHWQSPVTQASIQRFRHWLYDDVGAVDLVECKTMTQGEYDRRLRDINAFEKSGASLNRAGFRTY